MKTVKLFKFEESCQKSSISLARKAREGSGIFPFFCTRFSSFPVWPICFLSHMCFKNEEGSCSISFLLYTLFYLPIRCICLPSRKNFKNEEGSCSISPLLYTLFYLPCSVSPFFCPSCPKSTSAKSGQL